METPIPRRHFRQDVLNVLVSVGTTVLTFAAILAVIFGPNTIVDVVMGRG